MAAAQAPPALCSPASDPRGSDPVAVISCVQYIKYLSYVTYENKLLDRLFINCHKFAFG